MSSSRDKHLLLLGILSSHPTHGYRLNEILKSPTNAIRVGKGNAYQLLGKLAETGMVTSEEQREGRRPPRQVYSITATGRAELDRLLRERLSGH